MYVCVNLCTILYVHSNIHIIIIVQLMVDGVHGHVDHVVQHVVVEQGVVPEDVITLLLTVEEVTVLV